MFEKMIGVSPPQQGAARDSKVAESKDLRETSKADYKMDFEKILEKKLEAKREENRKSAESRAERKEKKSPGGIKKKVAQNDDKMVSNVMASKESEVETPELKIEIPAEIRVDITDKSKTGIAAELAKAAEAQPLLPQGASLTEASVVAQSPQQEQQLQMSDIEAELGAAVNFKPDALTQQSNESITQKLKSFDTDKNVKSTDAQSFEQNVMERLQKEMNAAQSTEKDPGGSEQKNQDQPKDLKSDLSGNQLHQATGQSHGEFKNHLVVSPQASDLTFSKLEENREANINDIMNQAQYLVKKGGGEVSVRMSPEGMGEVHLKVLLQDGKLNIEMQTQDKNVKKLIEESLTELKSGLAAHRLSLEHVKIDTVSATNTDNNTQFQSNFNQGGSEGRAREFFGDLQGQMNQQNRSKSSFSDSLNPSVSSPRSLAGSQANSALRTYGGTKGSTVNRVA